MVFLPLGDTLEAISPRRGLCQDAHHSQPMLCHLAMFQILLPLIELTQNRSLESIFVVHYI